MGKSTEVTQTADLFRLLEASQILEGTRLRMARELAQETPVCRTYARRLVAKGLLTRWQASQLLVGWHQLKIGKYCLCSQIGRGDFGRVFVAHHPELQREVAIKTLSRQFTRRTEIVERFLAEAREVAALDHRNILHVFDVDRDGDQYYLVMEYVNGSDLQRLVEGHGPRAWPDVTDYLLQSATGLAYAHGLGVVHRHLHPASLIVDDKQVVKIVGLGMGGLSDSRERSLETASGAQEIPSADYRAPEQRQPGAVVDARADIYSLGCIARFLLTGRPHGRECATPADESAASQWAGDRALVDVPPQLRSIIERMTVVDASLRTITAGEVVAELQTWRADTAEPWPLDTGAGPPPIVDSFTWTGPERSRSSVVRPSAPRGPSGPADADASGPTWRLARWLAVAAALVAGLAWGGIYYFGLALRDSSPAPAPAESSRANGRQVERAARPPRVASGAPREPVAEEGSARAWPKIGSALNEPAEEVPPEEGASPEPNVPAPSADNPVPPSEPVSPPATAPAAPATSEAPQPPPNPWRNLPTAVDIPLPESPVTADAIGSIDLGAVELSAEDPPEFTLLGGAVAGAKGHRVELAAPAGGPTSVWQVHVVELASADTLGKPVARFEWRDGHLWFRWEPLAEQLPAAHHVVNTVLQLTSQGHTHVLRLRTPFRVAPWAVNWKRLGAAQKLRLAAPPDPRQVRFEIVPPAMPPAVQGVTVPAEPIGINGDPVRILLGEEPEEHVMILHLAPELRGSAWRLTCEAFFRLDAAAEPMALSPRNLQKAEQVVVHQQLKANQTAAQWRDVVMKLPAQDPNRQVAQQRLAEAEAELVQHAATLERMLAVQRIYDAFGGEQAIHFRVYQVVDGCRVDLFGSAPDSP